MFDCRFPESYEVAVPQAIAGEIQNALLAYGQANATFGKQLINLGQAVKK